jgi:hypothetical protein
VIVIQLNEKPIWFAVSAFLIELLIVSFQEQFNNR